MSFIVKQKSVSFSRKISLEWVEYDVALYNKALFTQYAIKPPLELASWVTQRQAQFLAGRVAAKNSLPECYKNQPIGVGNHREPIWPNGRMGSISHADNISIAISQAKLSGGLGIDIQSVFDEHEVRSSVTLILSHSDQALFQGSLSGLSDRQFLTLVFSAKECFFKAVFNQVGEYFDFNVVSIKSFDSQARKIVLASDVELSENIKPSRNYVIDYVWINNNKIITFLNITA